MTDEQLWLPYEFLECEKEEEQNAKALKEKQRQEDIARLPYFEHPVNDHQKLFNLQWEYKHGDEAALGKFYDLCTKVCYKIVYHVCQHAKQRAVRQMSYIDRETKAENAATYFVEQYIKRPDFMRHESILSYLFCRVKYEIYYNTKADSLVTFVPIDTLKKAAVDPAQEQAERDAELECFYRED